MDLETITVDIRPRSSWEAIDIGFFLTKQYYTRLWLLWLLAATPSLFILTGLSLLLPGSTPKWALVLFWFFKPIYEPPLLYFISKALFGSQEGVKETIKGLQQKFTPRRFLTILNNRISLFRPFTLPVLLLEELTGKERQKRTSLLRNGSETAIVLTLVGFFIEVVIAISLMGVLFWIVPEELRWVNLGDFIFRPDNWLLLFSYFISCSIFAPFFICSGFMMYISRRVEVEAWDIEIGFKRVQQRLEKRKKSFLRTFTLLCLLGTISGYLLPGTAWTIPENPRESQEIISEVLTHKEFGEKMSSYHWVPKEKDTADSSSPWLELWQKLLTPIGKFLKKLSPHLAQYGQFLLCCCFGLLIAFVLLKYSRLRKWLGNTFRSKEKIFNPPEIMFGMDLRPENLPEDIAKTCLQLLAQGNTREAMSLLYRGTLSHLLNSHNLKIHSSFTENECCNEVRRGRPQPEATFFKNLTSAWVFIAYGHRYPQKDACRRLISQWKKLYGEQS